MNKIINGDSPNFFFNKLTPRIPWTLKDVGGITNAESKPKIYT
jgi:hypothetical protein